MGKIKRVCGCLSFLIILVIVLNPVFLIFPYSLYRNLFSEEEVYLPQKFWPKDGEKEDFYTHHYVHVSKTLKGRPSNVTFHYIEAGDPKKETIVFTMGAGEPCIIYSHIMKQFINEYHVISIDGKGFPYTSTHPSNKIDIDTTDPGSDYSPYIQGEEMVTALDKIGVKKFNLVSSDLMSIVTSFWVPEYQDRVLRYFRGQSHVGVQTYASVPQGIFFKTFPKLAEKLLSSVRVSIWRVMTGTGPSFLQREKRVSSNFKMSEQFNEKIIKVLRSGSMVPWVYFWLSLPKPTLYTQIQLFKQIKCPVLLLQGIEDKAQPIWFYDGSIIMDWKSLDEIGTEPRPKYVSIDDPKERKKNNAESFFPNSSWVELIWVEGSGHFPHFEAPNQYIEQLQRFLKVPTPI